MNVGLGEDAVEALATLIYDDTTQTPEKLGATVDKLGFKVSVVSVAEAPHSEAPARR